MTRFIILFTPYAFIDCLWWAGYNAELRKKDQSDTNLKFKKQTYGRKRVRFVLYGPRKRDQYPQLEVTL